MCCSGPAVLTVQLFVVQVCEEMFAFASPRDIPLSFSHVATLLAVDADLDGVFSQKVARAHTKGQEGGGASSLLPFYVLTGVAVFVHRKCLHSFLNAPPSLPVASPMNERCVAVPLVLYCLVVYCE